MNATKKFTIKMSFLRRWAELCEQPGPITDDDIRVSCGAVG